MVRRSCGKLGMGQRIELLSELTMEKDNVVNILEKDHIMDYF